MVSLLVILFQLLQVNGDVLVETKAINIEESVVSWKGAKVTGTHTGEISLKSGSLDFEGEMLKGGSFEIDMASMTSTDMSGQGAERLLGHLKNDDFFGVEKFPSSKFVITKVVSRGKPGEYKIIGELTIKSTSKEMKFDAIVADGMASANIEIDRTDFDIRYGSGSFFDNLGDKTIYDEFNLELNLKY